MPTGLQEVQVEWLKCNISSSYNNKPENEYVRNLKLQSKHIHRTTIKLFTSSIYIIISDNWRCNQYRWLKNGCNTLPKTEPKIKSRISKSNERSAHAAKEFEPGDFVCEYASCVKLKEDRRKFDRRSKIL